MKAYRVITATKDRADLTIQVGESIKEVINAQTGSTEVIDVKDITQELGLDIYEIQEALRNYKVNELEEMLVLAILQKYDNILW